MKVYCEAGAMRLELRQLQDHGRIEILMFPYENQSWGTSIATPSAATWEESKFPWDKGTFAWEKFSYSDKYQDILSIVGQKNIRDAKHVDSAFKSSCRCFFTPDKRDILANRTRLEALLGIRFFHPNEDWNEFLRFLDQEEGNATGGP